MFSFISAVMAQSLYDKKLYGPYVMLFKLNKEQTAYAVSHPYHLDTAFLYTHKVGEISSDSIIPLYRPQQTDYPIKPLCVKVIAQQTIANNNMWNLTDNGYFIEVRADLNQVTYKLIENPLFHPSVLRVGYETFVFVTDSAGLYISDANVLLDTFHCKYDAGIGGYQIPRDNISGTLAIDKKGDFTMHPVNGYSANANYGTPPRDQYQYAKISYQGYLVHNKPKYKIGDTLFYKAFVVNKKAKPLKHTLTARLSQNSTGKFINTEIKPNPKGAYSGFFVIGDSFRTDDYLNLYLLTAKGQAVQYAQIKLENYNLDDIQMQVNHNRNTITPGAGLSVFVTALNRAGQPILDANISLKISMLDINFTAADSFVISMDKMRDFYQAHMQSDATGTTVFELSPDIFPDLKGSYRCNVILRTPENEIKSSDFYFYSETTRDRAVTQMNNDTLHVAHFYNMVSAARTYRIKCFSKFDLVTDTTVQTPFKMYLAPNIVQAQIYRGDTFIATQYRTVHIPEIKGERTHDSINISFHSAFDIPVFYRIYKNNILIQSGNDTMLHFSQKDKSKNSYHFQYGILPGPSSTPSFFSKSFHLAERNLNVQIVQPQSIYPGQEVAVEVFVKNAWGKPVKKVNLTAWALNMQLDGIEKPNVPYLGKIKPQKELPLVPFAVGNFSYQQTAPMQNWNITLLKLKENKIYQLVFPDKGFQVLYDTVPDQITQVEFYNHSKGIFSPVRYAKFNDTLVFIENHTPKPGVILAKPGIYNLEVRLFDRLVRIQNVSIVKGKKNFICFNADSLENGKLGDTISPGHYTPSEFADILKHTLLFRFDQWQSDTLLVYVNGELKMGSDNGYRSAFSVLYTSKPMYSANDIKKTYYNAQSFSAFGPINNGDVITLNWKNGYAHEFRFQPGLTYSLTSKENIAAAADSIRIGQSYFPLTQFSNYQTNRFWWNPLAKKEKINSPDNYTPPQQSYNLATYQYKNYYPQRTGKYSFLNVFIPGSSYVQKIWLFNSQDSSLSNLQSSVYTGVYNSETGFMANRNIMAATDSGRYKNFILFIQYDDTLWLTKKFVIDSGMQVYYTFKRSDFKPISGKNYILTDRMAKILGREPYLKFEDTPTINKNVKLIKYFSKNGTTSLEGTVNGPDFKYVAANAFVVLEKNGLFVKGAVSNADGRFLLDDLEPGVYMLKIKAENYHYWITYALTLDKGYLHLLTINLKPYGRFKYSITTWTNNNAVSEGEPMFYNNGTMQFASSAYSMSDMKEVEATGKYNVKRMSVRGTRADGNATYIDGQRVIGNRGKKDSDGDGALDDVDEEVFRGNIYPKYKWNFGDGAAADSMVLQMAGNPSALQIRKNFQDFAYWVPNLTTDKKGFATYSVKFPDNITSWQTFVPAMDGKRHSGLGEMIVKSSKPISASLAVPQFLFEGDKLLAYGRINNFTGNTIQGEYSLLSDSVGITKNVELHSSMKLELPVFAKNAGDKIVVQNGFSMVNGYRDIERKTITVLDAAVVSGNSSFFLISKDTTLRFSGNKNDQSRNIIVYNQQLALLLDLVKNQTRLIYPDNQTLTDNLDALLTEKQISLQLGLDFEKDEEIKALIKKVRNSQLSDGSFGIFNSGKSDKLLSSYSAEILFKANEMGFSNNAWLNVAHYYEKMLPYLYNADCLHALYTLKSLNRNLKYNEFLGRINPNNLGLTDKLKYNVLLGMLSKNVDSKIVSENLHASPQGNLFVGNNTAIAFKCMPYFDNSMNTWLSWKLLQITKDETISKELLAQWMANESGGSIRNSNRAAQMLLANEMSKSNNNLKPGVVINGKAIAANEFPKKIDIKRDSTVTVEHTGSPVFILYSNTFRTYSPVSDNALFEINMNIKSGDTLHAGNEVSFEVEVFSKAHQDNVVLEIPIPAGCIFVNKIQGENYYEMQREYKPDRVLIYLSELPFGKVKFHFSCLPKYVGQFNIPPARVSLMFYPDQAAFTTKKTVVIE